MGQLNFVKPTECAICFGIPTSLEGFYHDIDAGRHKDYIREQLVCLDQFKDKILRPYTQVRDKILGHGVKIFSNVTLDEFGKICRLNDVQVVILFTHWVEKLDLVEMYDGLYSYRVIANSIPTDRSLFIDLTICHPAALAKEIKALNPDSNVKFIHKKAIPLYWFNFYMVLFEILGAESLHYIAAIEKTISHFMTLK